MKTKKPASTVKNKREKSERSTSNTASTSRTKVYTVEIGDNLRHVIELLIKTDYGNE